MTYRNVTTEVGGVTYTGSFEVRDGMVHVSSAYGSDSTQVSGTPADTVARIVLSELVSKHLRRG